MYEMDQVKFYVDSIAKENNEDKLTTSLRIIKMLLDELDTDIKTTHAKKIAAKTATPPPLPAKKESRVISYGEMCC